MMAAKLSLDHNIPMEDSIILATGRLYQAPVWTQDADFKGLKGVKYIQKNRGVSSDNHPMSQTGITCGIFR